MKNHLLLAITISVSACTVTPEESACLHECHDWNDDCGYEEEDYEEECEYMCLENEGGYPVTCEKCFDCLEDNQEEPLQFCSSNHNGFMVSEWEPCFNSCRNCGGF